MFPEVQAAPVLVRPDIAALAGEPDRIARLEAAIGEMQRRSRADPADPAGWEAHAMGHAQVCAALSNADDGQVHGGWWFLPWHRAYLAVTEWKLRAISGDPTLVLPYWNWSSDRRIPAPFARADSPLAQAVRFTPDRALRPAEVGWLNFDPAQAADGVAALGAQDFAATSPDAIAASFGGMARPNLAGWHGRSRLESIPHNAIHNYVGGEAPDGAIGDMTELGTAARDPLFFAHHANLDRLWEIWRQDPLRRAREPAGAFRQKLFAFPWLDGTAVTVSVGEVLDAGRAGSVYDSLSVFRGEPPAAADRLAAPHAVEILALPTGAGRRVLRITGVLPSQRPMSVEVMVGEDAVTVGAFAAGRVHSEPVYPDTELRFDVTAALRGAAGGVRVAIHPLPLGPQAAPHFTYAAMEIVAA